MWLGFFNPGDSAAYLKIENLARREELKEILSNFYESEFDGSMIKNAAELPDHMEGSLSLPQLCGISRKVPGQEVRGKISKTEGLIWHMQIENDLYDMYLLRVGCSPFYFENIYLFFCTCFEFNWSSLSYAYHVIAIFWDFWRNF